MGRGGKASGYDREGLGASDEPTQVPGVALDMGLCQGRRGFPVPMGPRVEGLQTSAAPNKHNDTPSHMPHELVTEACDRVLGLGENREMC